MELIERIGHDWLHIRSSLTNGDIARVSDRFQVTLAAAAGFRRMAR